MMLVKKTALFASVAAAALMIAPSGAFAFDEVNWVWDKYVDEYVEIDIDIEAEFLPSGMVEVEKLQAYFGDVEATATAYGIYNRAGGEFEGTIGEVEVPVSGSGNFDLTYVDPADQNTPPGPGRVLPTVVNDATGLVLSLGTGNGTADENTNTISDIGYTIDGTVTVDVGDINIVNKDAIDLPKVHNAATAVANNQDIYTTSALFLHDAQIATGDINKLDPDGDPNGLAFVFAANLLTQVDGQLDGVNAHTDLAILAVLGAATGFLEPANITATAHAFDILNASVDNSATAVGNNASFEIATTMKAAYETVTEAAYTSNETTTHTESPSLVIGDGLSDLSYGYTNDDGVGNTDNVNGFADSQFVVDTLSFTPNAGGDTASLDIDYLTQDGSWTDTVTEFHPEETDIVVKTDAVMIADLTQLLIGDVTATATTGPDCLIAVCNTAWDGEIGEYANILIDGYTGFGAAGFGNLAPANYDVALNGDFVQTALVKNVATAVGNNLTIRVDGCSVCAPTPTVPAGTGG